MAEGQHSSAVLGAAGGLLVAGVLLALFGSLAYGIVLVGCGLALPIFFRRSSE